MPFQVKGIVTNILGDESKWPCKFGYKIGDEIIFDGEKCIGRVCPALWSLIAPKVIALRNAGPRYIEPMDYAPIFYSTATVPDPSMKKYDGLAGFRPVEKGEPLPKYHMASLAGLDMGQWPPRDKRRPKSKPKIMCPDLRTAVVMEFEAFDLSDNGYDVGYFRREMVILSRVLAKPGIEVDKIIDEFTKFEREEIYPTLGRAIVEIFAEELELMGYLEIRSGKATVTDKGKRKLEDFKANVSAQEREALRV